MNMESFLFLILIPSFNLLFVYSMSENEERIHNNSHEEVVPHHSHLDLGSFRMVKCIYLPGLIVSYAFEFKHMK